MGTCPLPGLEVRRYARSTSFYLFCRGRIDYLRMRAPLRHQDRVCWRYRSEMVSTGLSSTRTQMERFAVVVLLPVFFTRSRLNTQLTMINSVSLLG